jgi:hypothetical protein
MLLSVLSILPVLGAFWWSRFCLSCCPTHQILSQIWAKPPASLSFDLGVIEAFETKLDLEALDFDEGDDVDKDSSGFVLPNNDDYIFKFTVLQELHNKR